MQTIFYSVFIFNHITNKPFPNFKNIICIKKKPSSNFLAFICIKYHNYNLDNNKESTKISLLSLFSSIAYLLNIVWLIYDNNIIFYKFFVVLPVYQVYQKDNEDEL